MILVTGATGRVGRPLVDLLVAASTKVRALTRDPASANLPDGVEAAGVAELPMAGIDSVFYVMAAFPEGPGRLLDAARAHGVRRIVVLSSYSALDEDPKNFLAVRHRELERAVEESAIPFTFLRPAGGLAATALEWADQIRTTGVARGPYGQAQSAPVHERDVADIAARALLTDELLGERPLFSGPESLSYADRARIIGEVIGKPVHFEEISHDEARVEMLAAGVPAPAIEARLRMFAKLVGVPHKISPVEPFSGKPGRTFATWVADNADAFR